VSDEAVEILVTVRRTFQLPTSQLRHPAVLERVPDVVAAMLAEDGLQSVEKPVARVTRVENLSIDRPGTSRRLHDVNGVRSAGARSPTALESPSPSRDHAAPSA
jgi:hypothetical protein